VNDIVIAILDWPAPLPGTRIAYVDFDATTETESRCPFTRSQGPLCLGPRNRPHPLPLVWKRNRDRKRPCLGYTVNLPLEPGTDDEVYSYVLDSAVFPILKPLPRTSSLPRSERTP